MRIDFAELAAARPLLSSARRWRVKATMLLLIAGQFASTASTALYAAEPAGKGGASRAARDEALRGIPLAQMTPDAQGKVSAVLKDISIFRRLPTQSIDCDPAIFHFLVANPDVVVNMWRVMDVTNITMDRQDANHFRCSDGDGTTCRAEYVFRNHDTLVIYADGVYEGPMYPRPIRGQCVTVLKTAELRETNGRFYVTARLDVFLHVENAGVELVAKMFQSWLGKTIDHNFVETAAFIGNVSHTAETNPQGVRKLAARLSKVDVDRRSQFSLLISEVSANLATVNLAGSQQIQTARP